MVTYIVVYKKPGFKDIVKSYSNKSDAEKSIKWYASRGWSKKQMRKIN